jgi:hypothetical protein
VGSSCIIIGLALAASTAYNAILRSEVRKTTERAGENLRRAEACEDALAIARRAHTAAIEAQGYADTQRGEIEATRADMAQRVEAIVDSGELDERVCELARAAYHSAMCTASDGNAMHAAPGASAP